MANKRTSHLADCFFHSSECISTNMAMKVDKLNLSKRYSRVLKACHNVSASFSFFFLFFCVCHSFSSLLLYFFYRRPYTLAIVSATLVVSQLCKSRYRGCEVRLDMASLGKRNLERRLGLCRSAWTTTPRRTTECPKS